MCQGAESMFCWHNELAVRLGERTCFHVLSAPRGQKDVRHFWGLFGGLLTFQRSDGSFARRDSDGENNEPQNPHSPLMPYEVAQVWGRHVADMRRVMCGTVTGKEAIPQLWIPIWLHSTYGYCTEKEPHAW